MVKVAADSFMGLFSTSAASAAAKALAYPIAAVGDWQVMADSEASSLLDRLRSADSATGDL